MGIPKIFQTVKQWYAKTPERALDQAYRAAIKIKDIEDKHFNGQKVSQEFSDYGDSVINYFKSEVQGHLQTIKVRLNEFKSSRLITNLVGLSDLPVDSQYGNVELLPPNSNSLLLEKLKFIDQVIAPYQNNGLWTNETSTGAIVKSKDGTSLPEVKPKNPQNKSFLKIGYIEEINGETQKLQTATEKTGVLPRSFLNTLNRIKREMDPKSEESEEAVLKRFRNSRYKTAISIKFILLLIIVPLLTHQLTKTFFLSRVVENYLTPREEFVFINKDLEEEALVELKNYEEALRFRGFIGLGEKLNPEQIEQELQNKAQEITEIYRKRGVDAIANIFADIFSLIAFGVVIAFSRKEIEIVKAFLDEILYNLSDSAKAFLIILFTDMFVGFHSPHGWEVILERMSSHFGLPENREFNFLFIATFPVILDTVLKYWIFRYLNRISPSAVATYRNMNE